MNPDIFIALCLLTVGFLYASVGHGGASGYIAIFSLFGIAVSTYKPLVLVMNIVIAGIAFIQFYRAGYFKWKLCWPFLITSIPAAFIGSAIAVQSHVYNLLLGLALLFPVVRLFGLIQYHQTEMKVIRMAPALLVGGVIGLLSGMLNIGGGIFLSPVLILAGWATPKQSAAISALFIVCNSAAGLIGGKPANYMLNQSSFIWFAAAVTGGIIGSYMGSKKYPQKAVQYVLASVLVIASAKLILFT
jgi:uncharacterized membrane protein YfcA